LDLDSYDFFPQVKFYGYQWAPLWNMWLDVSIRHKYGRTQL
jgi:hypothetical protein